MAVVQGQTLGRPLAGGTEVVAQRAARKRRSRWLEMATRQPIGLLSAIVLLTIIIAGVFAEAVSPREPATQLLRDSLKPPGTMDREGVAYWLGTDSLGRDVFSRIVHGARISLAVGGAAVIIGTIGGLLIGLVSGYRGGRLDLFIQRIMDSVQAIPTLVLATLLVASLGPSGRNLIVTAIAIGVTQIPRANRVIRSNVLSVSREVFVESAKAVGAPEARIIFRHILPNVVATTLIIFSTSIGAAIVTEATLSFLGLAAPPPWVTWGGMLTIQGRQFMVTAPWLLIAPAVALSVTVLAFNFLGDAVRDEMDPAPPAGDKPADIERFETMLTRNVHTRLIPLLAAAGLMLAACAPQAPAPAAKDAPKAAPTTAPAAKEAAPAAKEAAPAAKDAGPAAAKPATSASASQCEPGKEFWRSHGPPKRGGVIVRSGGLESIDPTRAVGWGDAGTQVYNTLLETRGCRYGDPIMAPSLAKSWEISPDGLTYTLKLQNAKWHNLPPVNGRPFTSADVAWSIEHHRSGTVARSLWDNVAHEEPDPQTVILKLQQPDADFLGKLGHYQNVMLAREVKEQHGDFSQVAVGTGAFMLKEFKPDQEIVTVKNPDYWEMGEDGQPLPYADGVRSLLFQDYNAEVAAFRGGQIDFTGTFGMLKLEADATKAMSPTLKMTTELQFTHAAVWFRLDKAPWNDPRVRKAILLTLDREDYVASNRGGAVEAGYVPVAYPEFAWDEARLRDKFKLDREAAKGLLQQAGIAPGSLNVTLKTSSQYAEDAEVAQQHLNQIGITTKVVVEGRNFTTILNGGNFDDLAWGVLGGQPLLNFWVGDFLRTGNSLNPMKYSDPEVDRLAALQSRELDPAKRKVITDQIQDRLFEDVPYAPTVSRIYYHFTQCRIKNSPLTKPNHNHVAMKWAWIDPAGC